ncbi:ABC transporter permease [Roseiarcaceae bacterium H3SJ34-1]|uniref:ABC transporter permease n=1 Tax=Terripilifer ovatus TaxID=3032367 RepID=UPI003AB97ED8|nr:ABC transporter permease [Roseiarcaceae bacterium H3SJ34-1]
MSIDAIQRSERRESPGLLRKWASRHGWAVGSVVTGLAIWEIAARGFVASKLFLASPSQIVAAIGPLWRSGELQVHFYTSALEFVLGYGAACILGIALGFLIASSRRCKQALQPWVSGLYATPTVALAPLFILWFGVGIFSKIVVVALLVIFPVIINTETGLRQTPQNLVETVRSFGASRRQIFYMVSLPAALPFIFAGLRLGIGRGLIGVVVAELFGARAGLGQLIQQSAETFNMPALFVGVVVLAVAGIVLTSGFVWLEKRLVPWGQD